MFSHTIFGWQSLVLLHKKVNEKDSLKAFFYQHCLKLSLFPRPQAASSSSPTPGWRTAPSSSATTASATCAATRAPRSCRSRARATSCMGPKPSGWPSPRWLRPCWARRRGEWRSTSTAKTVGENEMFCYLFARVLVGSGGVVCLT